MVAGLFTTCLLSLLLLPITVLASPHASSPLFNRHHGLARRAEGNVQLYKRFTGIRMTFYNPDTGSPGSCGGFIKRGDYTVAMSIASMDKATMCGKQVTITYNGVSVTATIGDTCPVCPPNGFDLTEGLFAALAPLSVGVIFASWEFGAGAAPPPSPSPSPSPPPPSPTHTWAPPPPPTISVPSVSIALWSSSSHTPTFTHSSVSHTNTQNSTSATSSSSVATPSVSINLASGPASGLAEPTGTVVVTPGTINNIQTLFQTFISLDALISVAHSN